MQKPFLSKKEIHSRIVCTTPSDLLGKIVIMGLETGMSAGRRVKRMLQNMIFA